ncbi:MAG: GNAT family N-acetyltransferase [Chloroflexi bacterium]|nr:GNAT family N-acetyltransferase [Chloroflexota bacterium]
MKAKQKSDAVEIMDAVADKQRDELDLLLWSVLWQPLGLPRDIRQTFELSGSEIDLIAVDDGSVVGGVVVSRISANKYEIRHIAVKAGYQGKSVGTRLVEELIRQIRQDTSISVQTWARNTSAGFFTKSGFKPAGERLEHPAFAAHGINFQRMHLKVP